MDLQDSRVHVECLIENLKSNVRSGIWRCEDNRHLWVRVNLDWVVANLSPFAWWRCHIEVDGVVGACEIREREGRVSTQKMVGLIVD